VSDHGREGLCGAEFSNGVQSNPLDAELCTGCLDCVEACRTDVLIPNPEKGKPPIVLYPDECWFCGNCVARCPCPS